MPQLLGPIFSPMSAEALGTCCASLAKKQSVPAGSIRSPLLLLPTAPEGRGATSSWDGLQWSIPLPRSPPGVSLGSASQHSSLQD